MSELNTDYNNTELLDQELTDAELAVSDEQLDGVAGGSNFKPHPIGRFPHWA